MRFCHLTLLKEYSSINSRNQVGVVKMDYQWKSQDGLSVEKANLGWQVIDLISDHTQISRGQS